MAAYRDRYKITDDHPIGAAPDNTAQKIDAARAHTAFNRARSLTHVEREAHESARRARPERIGPTL